MGKRTRWAVVLGLLFALALLTISAASADSSAVWPASGKNSKKNGKLEIDVSHTDDGYFMAAVTKKNKHKLKLRVVKGGETMTYDLNGNSEYEVFPLQLGSGSYEISLYENVSGKKYAQEGKISIKVSLRREDAAFLVPTQYINYTKASQAVKDADKELAGKSDKQAFDWVCNYMKTKFVYDFIKATKVKASTLPDIDGTYKTKMGICQDLSAIMCCMLRTQGIPTKLMIGYADKQYHAWVMVTINGEETFYDPTAALSAISKVKTYTVERYY